MQNQQDRSRVWLPHSSHWGAFFAAATGDEVLTKPHPGDPTPPLLFHNFRSALTHRSRVQRPAVRKGWLEGRSRELRGSDEFVEMTWDEVIPLLASELDRVRTKHTVRAIFGGSYGWSSAGRFHHAQSQVHRFLNTALGGYTRSVGSYSAGAAEVLFPHIIGSMERLSRDDPTWQEMSEITDLVVCFGGMPVRNATASAGGNSRHVALPSMRAARQRGARFVLFSPLRDDLPPEIDFTWYPNVPMSDTAIMLGIAHTLCEEAILDRAFIDRYCVGFAKFEDYLFGKEDGVVKNADWAEAISGVGASEIRTLARDMTRGRTLIVTSQALQRAEHGEQPIWMALVLAAMLGQVGLPGGGYVYSLGSIGNVGKPVLDVPIPTLDQGRNGINSFIPVARIADMLLMPGGKYSFNGEELEYPDIRLVYWAGGNPFHHHQDLTRLRQAFFRPETIVVHEQFWTATARHADIVLPATMTLEREDIGASKNDPGLIAMHQIVKPRFEARDDFEIFADLADHLGRHHQFTEGRNQRQWLACIYEPTRAALRVKGYEAPSFEEFWEMGELQMPLSQRPGAVRSFREDPARYPLKTPSGKIEIFSETIESFGYQDCRGMPRWFEPAEGVTDEASLNFPLQLIANQPPGKLHSQLDFGDVSLSTKHNGREIVRINPADAQKRSINNHDLVRVFNDRGACLAVAVITNDIRQRTAQISTGAWLTPSPDSNANIMCLHGNPNVLTRDKGTSQLAQGSSGQLCLIEIDRWYEGAPWIDPYQPPKISSRG